MFRTSEAEKGLLPRLTAAGLLRPGWHDADRGIFHASTGQISLSAKAETFRAETPGCEALILPAGKAGEAAFLKVENRIGRGVFSIMSADGRPLQKSGRLLFLHLTDLLPSRTRFGNKRMTLLSRWGSLPFLAARGEARITLKAEPGARYRLYAANTGGKRLAELPLEQSPDRNRPFHSRSVPQGRVGIRLRAGPPVRWPPPPRKRPEINRYERRFQ